MSDAVTFADRLRELLGDGRVQRDAPLAPLTTFKVGGVADWLIHARTRAEITGAIEIARAHGQAVTVLGGGSNVLISDGGLRGLVIRIHGGDVVRVDARTIRADGGVTINGLVRWTISHGVAGLEAWAGTPGTVGGAIHGNAHFRGRLISELIERVTLLALDGSVDEVPVAAMEFGYDYSRLHRTREVVIAADFKVTDGQPEALRATARESLAFRKRTQPLESASAGCIFQNPDPARDQVPDGIPWSAGRSRRPGRPQGCARRPRTRIDNARQLHRQRRRRQRERGQRAGRAVQGTGAVPFRRAAARRNRLSGLRRGRS